MNTKNCPQAENLVAYLYGEANDVEKKTFERHLSACDLCRDELAAFGMVRESVVTWRDEMLSSLVAPAVSQSIAPVIASSNATRKRSALAAIREFFSLSPAWLQGMTAFAGLAFLALIIFAVVQLGGKKEPQNFVKGEQPLVSNPSPNVPPINRNENKDEVAVENDNSAPKKTIKRKPNEGGAEKVIYRKNQGNQEVAKKQNQRHLKKQQVPRLTNEEMAEFTAGVNEEDDNSLRLSSLLDTIND